MTKNWPGHPSLKVSNQQSNNNKLTIVYHRCDGKNISIWILILKSNREHAWTTEVKIYTFACNPFYFVRELNES